MQSREPFTMVPLEIKNKPSLRQSLSLFVEGDMLEGDNAVKCAPCNKKVATLKRTVFESASLPNVLILHLKRFSFNFDTMQKVKLNDRFEFPESFSMEPYTKEVRCSSQHGATRSAAREIP